MWTFYSVTVFISFKFLCVRVTITATLIPNNNCAMSAYSVATLYFVKDNLPSSFHSICIFHFTRACMSRTKPSVLAVTALAASYFFGLSFFINILSYSDISSVYKLFTLIDIIFLCHELLLVGQFISLARGQQCCDLNSTHFIHLDWCWPCVSIEAASTTTTKCFPRFSFMHKFFQKSVAKCMNALIKTVVLNF